MFPTVTSLLEYFFGGGPLLPFQTFGLFVAMAFLAAYWAFTQEFKRKEQLGYIHSFQRTVTVGAPQSAADLAGNAIFGFLIGYKLVDCLLNYTAFANDIQTFFFSARGNWPGGILGAIGFAYWSYYENKKQRLSQPKQVVVTVHPYELMGTILIWAAVAGFAGAKIFNGLENWDELVADPVRMLIGGDGLTFYGGLICGGAAVLYIANKNGVKPLTMLDIGGPGMMLAYGVGRIGCQMAGDGDWGISNLAPKPGWLSWAPDWMWAFNYPHNVAGMDPDNRIAGCVGKYCYALREPAYPTPFYEAVVCILLFFVLWQLRHKFKSPGALFGIYLILAGVERFFVELIRVNTKYHLFGISFTQAEMISLFMVLGGSFLIWNGHKNEQKLKAA